MAQSYLTPQQAADRLQVSVETVRRYLRSGKLRGSHVSRKCWRISETQIEAFMREANG